MGDDRGVAVELRRSSEFSRRELAAIFTASYQDYFVPFKVDEGTLDHMVDAFDLVLAHSLVAVEAGAAVGLANLGRRGERTWVGGVGVIPARRDVGIGEQLMRGLFKQARDLGARTMALEVITRTRRRSPSTRSSASRPPASSRCCRLRRPRVGARPMRWRPARRAD